MRKTTRTITEVTLTEAEYEAALDKAYDEGVKEQGRVLGGKWLAFTYGNVRRLVEPTALTVSKGGRVKVFGLEYANGRGETSALGEVKSYFVNMMSTVSEVDSTGDDVSALAWVLEGTPKADQLARELARRGLS